MDFLLYFIITACVLVTYKILLKLKRTDTLVVEPTGRSVKTIHSTKHVPPHRGTFFSTAFRFVFYFFDDRKFADSILNVRAANEFPPLI